MRSSSGFQAMQKVISGFVAILTVCPAANGLMAPSWQRSRRDARQVVYHPRSPNDRAAFSLSQQHPFLKTTTRRHGTRSSTETAIFPTPDGSSSTISSFSSHHRNDTTISVSSLHASSSEYVHAKHTTDTKRRIRRQIEEELQRADQQQHFYQPHETLYSSTIASPAAFPVSKLATTDDDAADNKKSGTDQVLMARLLLIGAAALYGTNFSLVKLMGESDLPVGLSTTLRFALAALVTSPWLFARSKKASSVSMTTTDNDDVDDDRMKDMSPALGATLFGLEVGFLNTIGYVCQAVGLETTLASTSAFLCSLAVVVVPFMNYLSGRHLRAREWIGAILALLGVAMLELGGITSSDFAFFAAAMEPPSFGDYASMVQPFAFGMGFWRMEHAMQKYPNEANRCTAAQLLAAVIGSALHCAATEGASWDMAQLQAWLTDPALLGFIAWTGIISTALSVYMETIALTTLSAAETTLLLSTEPLWGAGFAALIIGEQFGTDAVVGGLMILVGCLYSSLGVEGMQSLLFKRKQQGSSLEAQNSSNNNPQKKNKDNNNNGVLSSVVGVGALLATNAIVACNSISIGARVTILQVQDLVEDLF